MGSYYQKPKDWTLLGFLGLEINIQNVGSARIFKLIFGFGRGEKFL
tara:strand:- start:283 stop:420 length:138 start_codon:yes stop_codon:yes gene_type:complete